MSGSGSHAWSISANGLGKKDGPDADEIKLRLGLDD